MNKDIEKRQKTYPFRWGAETIEIKATPETAKEIQALLRKEGYK